MSEKRRDNKGRILRSGESQRANGTYDYRYLDVHKKRRSVYAQTLDELRRKEVDIQRDLADGIDYAAGDMTVSELVDRYMGTRRDLKKNSLRAYGTAIKRIHSSPFGSRRIRNVRLSDKRAGDTRRVRCLKPPVACRRMEEENTKD